jgi:hypothetical protein
MPSTPVARLTPGHVYRIPVHDGEGRHVQLEMRYIGQRVGEYTFSPLDDGRRWHIPKDQLPLDAELIDVTSPVN